jgi:hypothetical protein
MGWGAGSRHERMFRENVNDKRASWRTFSEVRGHFLAVTFIYTMAHVANSYSPPTPKSFNTDWLWSP